MDALTSQNQRVPREWTASIFAYKRISMV